MSASTANAMAVEQRPITLAALGAKAQTAGWKTIPSWYLVAKNDHAIAPDLERFMARRAGSHTVEVNAPHLVMATDPDAVDQLIEAAAHATR
jgi:pimeloyl-ACP methyl ester carboxylesterase